MHSNTTLVKVKYNMKFYSVDVVPNSNTTLVKVKFVCYFAVAVVKIQIQHLLKLNSRKINLYDFHYTIKSIDIQGFQLFFTSDNRIFGDFIKRFNFQALEEFFLILAGNFMVNKILSSSKKQKATIIDDMHPKYWTY